MLQRGDRVPQNSASSSHQRLFSDLQAVYQKIIQTSGASFPLRSVIDNRKSLHTAPVASRSKQLCATAPDSSLVFNPRASSAYNSVEEIVIKPLQFHDREFSSPKSGRRSGLVSASSVSVTSADTRYSSRSVGSLATDVNSRFSRRRSRLSLPCPEYSEQSIRYVAEQVSLEKARQLKLRSNVKQHRVDRRYFVCGSRLGLQKQAFEETDNSIVLQINGVVRPVRASQYAKRRIVFTGQHGVQGLEVSGTHLDRRPSGTHTPTSTRRGSVGFDDVDEISLSTVAIPTAHIVTLDDGTKAQSICSKDSLDVETNRLPSTRTFEKS